MNKGFTMVELLAVIIILAAIMIITIPSYNSVSSSVKESSYKNKIDAMSSSMIKFASVHLIDEIKPEGLCETEEDCCMEYDLYNYIVEYGIYSIEKAPDIIVDPITNEKLYGCMRLKYNPETYSIDAEFIKDRILIEPKSKCIGG